MLARWPQRRSVNPALPAWHGRGMLCCVGRLTSVTDALRNTTTYVPDGIGQVTQVTDANGGITKFEYDAAGNLQTVTDAKQNIAVTNTYDLRNRIISSCDARHNCTTYSSYDPDDNLMKVASGTLIETDYTYDNLNRRSTINYGVGSSTPSGITLTYDLGDRLLKAVDTLYPTPITRQYGTSNTSLASGLDFMSQEVTPQGTVNYVPDSAGRRSQMSWTNGQASRIVNYGYDNADNLKTVTPQGAAGSVIGYDNDSRRQTVTLPNGLVVTYGYDPDSNVNSITYKNGATTLGTLTYGYDADDRKISTGGTYARTNLPTTAQSFSYYPDNSLQKLGALTVQNDNDGNITCMVSSPCPQFSYDVRGHLQQVQVLPSVFVDYSYDTFGRRYQVTAVAGSTTTNQYDGFNILDTWPQALESYAGMNLAGLGLDDFFGVSNSSGSVNESFLRDALNSTIAITDASGNILDQTTYDAYGNTTDSVPTQASVFEFTGRENDGDGLYYMRSRYYAPSIARFISRDPIGIAGGLNLYEYAGDSPTNATDLTGS